MHKLIQWPFASTSKGRELRCAAALAEVRRVRRTPGCQGRELNVLWPRRSRGQRRLAVGKNRDDSEGCGNVNGEF